MGEEESLSCPTSPSVLGGADGSFTWDMRSESHDVSNALGSDPTAIFEAPAEAQGSLASKRQALSENDASHKSKMFFSSEERLLEKQVSR